MRTGPGLIVAEMTIWGKMWMQQHYLQLIQKVRPWAAGLCQQLAGDCQRRGLACWCQGSMGRMLLHQQVPERRQKQRVLLRLRVVHQMQALLRSQMHQSLTQVWAAEQVVLQLAD